MNAHANPVQPLELTQLVITPPWYPHYRALRQVAIESGQHIAGVSVAYQRHPTAMTVLYWEPHHGRENIDAAYAVVVQTKPQNLVFWLDWPLPPVEQKDVWMTVMDLSVPTIAHLMESVDLETAARTRERFRQYVIALISSGGLDTLDWRDLWLRFFKG